MAHILEKHYYKISRYPQAGKFTVPVTTILEYLRDAADITVTPIQGSLNFERMFQAKEEIGFDKNGHYTNIITIITNADGGIVTAFPGTTTNCFQNKHT